MLITERFKVRWLGQDIIWAFQHDIRTSSRYNCFCFFFKDYPLDYNTVEDESSKNLLGSATSEYFRVCLSTRLKRLHFFMAGLLCNVGGFYTHCWTEILPSRSICAERASGRLCLCPSGVRPQPCAHPHSGRSSAGRGLQHHRVFIHLWVRVSI